MKFSQVTCKWFRKYPFDRVEKQTCLRSENRILKLLNKSSNFFTFCCKFRSLLPYWNKTNTHQISILKNGPIVYFCYFLNKISIIQIEKRVDGVLGIRARGRRMVCADETTELWLPRNMKRMSIIQFETFNCRPTIESKWLVQKGSIDIGYSIPWSIPKIEKNGIHLGYADGLLSM